MKHGTIWMAWTVRNKGTNYLSVLRVWPQPSGTHDDALPGPHWTILPTLNCRTLKLKLSVGDTVFCFGIEWENMIKILIYVAVTSTSRPWYGLIPSKYTGTGLLWSSDWFEWPQTLTSSDLALTICLRNRNRLPSFCGYTCVPSPPAYLMIACLARVHSSIPATLKYNSIRLWPSIAPKMSNITETADMS